MYNIFTGLTEGLKVNMVISKYGEYKEILNMDEIGVYVMSIFDSLISSNEDDYTVGIVYQQMKEMLKDDKQSQSSLFPEIRLFHQAYNKE